ncbi:HAD-like domain-containing protein [Immersiella caudata]|uniref:Mitochondrial import inner membrane translocase subunit TIM50 n=1 Tax=Immersiella caudata TaxID=314043 RepID=A0AA40C6I1_9PEZI|nr:HAD-like domain-containing protein [Immersiella caudata]
MPRGECIIPGTLSVSYFPKPQLMKAVRWTQRSLRLFSLDLGFEPDFSPFVWLFKSLRRATTKTSGTTSHCDPFSSSAQLSPELFTMAGKVVLGPSRRSRNRRNRASQQEANSADAAPVAPSFNMNPLANWAPTPPQFQPQKHQQLFSLPGFGGNTFIPDQNAITQGGLFSAATGGFPFLELNTRLDDSSNSTPAPISTRQPPPQFRGKRAKRRWLEQQERQLQAQPSQSRPQPPLPRQQPKCDKDPVQPPSAASGGVPEPTPAYLLRASFIAQTVPEPRPILVVIDLNGTLLHRPSRHAPHAFIERPHARSFLTYCIETFHVVIWSSARPDNVKKMCRQLLTPDQRQRVIAMWGRDKFGLTPEDYNSRVQCYKRLTTLWGNPLIASAHPTGGSWNQGNTVLIDDSTEKARSEPYNAITLSEFVGDTRETPEVLPLVHDYLNTLAVQADISTYIRAHPFGADEPIRQTGQDMLVDDRPGSPSPRIDS